MKRKSDEVLEHKQFAFKAEDVGDDGTFKGYGSVFGNVDSYREIVMPGAFKESLAEIAASGDPLPALWQHYPDQPIGGYDVLREDKKGLWVEGFLMVNEIAQAKEAHALMKRRVVKGMSIGYIVREDTYDEKDNVRKLLQLDLREISPVTFPANRLAEVESVKAAVSQILHKGQLPSMKEFEDFLREAGFSKSQAAAIAVHGLGKLHRGEPDSVKGEVMDLLKNFSLSL